MSTESRRQESDQCRKEATGPTGEIINGARRVYDQREVTVRRRRAGVQVSRYLNCGMRAGMANADPYSVGVSVADQNAIRGLTGG
jgi:hypothetical protein